MQGAGTQRTGTNGKTNEVWLTATEAAAYLKVKPRTVLLWARQGKLKGFSLSGTKRRVWRFHITHLDAALLGQDPGVVCSTLPSVLLTKGAEN